MNITPATIKSALFQVISNAENNIHDFIKNLFASSRVSFR